MRIVGETDRVKTNIDYLVDLVRRKCQSPIERSFAEAWVRLCHSQHSTVCTGFGPEAFLQLIPESVKRTPLHVDQYDVLMCQVRIEDFRVDFVLGRSALKYPDDSGGDGDDGGYLVRLPMLVIECDGHAFHERTKEQAQRDKSRDRRLHQLGYRVVRFSGSEIWRDAGKCAEEVDTIFQCLLDPGLAEIGSLQSGFLDE